MTESTAPLRIDRWPRSHPLIRVWAVKGMKVAWALRGRGFSPYFAQTSVTIDRPSGVSSARLARCDASARSSMRTPAMRSNSLAMRLP